MLRVLLAMVVILTMYPVDVTRAGSARYSLEIIHPSAFPFVQEAWLYDLNNSGQATGYVFQAATRVYDPVIFEGGTLELLPAVRPNGSESSLFFGSDINNLGQVIGTMIDNSNPGNPKYTLGFLTPGGPLPFPHVEDFVPGSTTSTHLNDHRQVVQLGLDRGLDQDAIMFYDNGTARRLDFLPPIGAPGGTVEVGNLTNSGKFAINLYFECSFECGDAPSIEPVLADIPSGTSRSIAIPAGSESLHIASVAEDGSFLGMAYSLSDEFRPVPELLGIWDAEGNLEAAIPLIDGLNLHSTFRNSAGQVFASTPAGVFLFEGDQWKEIAWDRGGVSPSFVDLTQINDAGQMVGTLYDTEAGHFYAFVASPVPEPSTLALSALASAIVILLHTCRCNSRPYTNAPLTVRRDVVGYAR